MFILAGGGEIEFRAISCVIGPILRDYGAADHQVGSILAPLSGYVQAAASLSQLAPFMYCSGMYSSIPIEYFNLMFFYTYKTVFCL